MPRQALLLWKGHPRHRLEFATTHRQDHQTRGKAFRCDLGACTNTLLFTFTVRWPLPRNWVDTELCRLSLDRHQKPHSRIAAHLPGAEGLQRKLDAKVLKKVIQEYTKLHDVITACHSANPCSPALTTVSGRKFGATSMCPMGNDAEKWGMPHSHMSCFV